MLERLSKIILLIEALVFLAPVTILTSIYAVMLVSFYSVDALWNEPLGAHIGAVFTSFGLVIQLIGWATIHIFLVKGRIGLKSIPNIFIYMISFGAVLVILSILVYILSSWFEKSPIIFSYLGINIIGLPAVIPFIHIILERFYDQSTIDSNSN